MKREQLLMLKETLSSLNTASGHGLLKGPCSHREASVTSHVAVCTGRSSLSPSGVQSIKTRFAFHRRDVRESPDCAIGRTNFSCLSLHSPRTTRYAQIKFNLQVLSFLIQNFPGKVKLADNTGYIANQIDCDYPLSLELLFKYIVFNTLV